MNVLLLSVLKHGCLQTWISDKFPVRLPILLYRFCGSCLSRSNSSSNLKEESFCMELLDWFARQNWNARIIFLRCTVRTSKNVLVNAFSQEVIEATFFKIYIYNLANVTFSTTISYVAQAFRSNPRK